MQNEFDAPTPVQTSNHDFSADPLYGKSPINYNAGSLDSTSVKLWFNGKISPEDLLCRFHYYDSEQKAKVEMSSFTAFVIAVCYGAFSNGKERGETNYQSNLVRDTRTDILQCFYFARSLSSEKYERHVLATGNYKADIAPALLEQGRKNAYTKVLVVYIPELQDIRAIHLNATSEAGFVKAIAAARGVPEHKASLYDIGQLSSEFWAFRFTGAFEPVVFSPKDAKNVPETVPATDKAQKIFFQPVIKAGVIRATTKGYEERFAALQAMYAEFEAYNTSEQAHYAERMAKGAKGAANTEQPAPAPAAQPATTPRTALATATAQEDDPFFFPTKDVNNYEVVTPGDMDELPF